MLYYYYIFHSPPPFFPNIYIFLVVLHTHIDFYNSISTILSAFQIFREVGSDGKNFPDGRAPVSGKLGEIMSEMENLKADKAEAMYIPEDKKAYTAVYKKAQKQLRSFVAELTDLRRASERVELMGESGGGVKAVTNREVASEALRIQQDNKNITKQIISTLDETKDIGMQNLEELDRQNQVIKSIGSKVLGLRSDVKRAGNLLRQFRRRMMTDKLIVCFIFLVVVGIAFCIIYAAVVPGQDSIYLTPAARPPSIETLEKDYNSVTGQTTAAPITTTTTAAAAASTTPGSGRRLSLRGYA